MCWCPANNTFSPCWFYPPFVYPPPLPSQKIHTTHHLRNIFTRPLPTPTPSIFAAGSVTLSVPPSPHPLSLPFPCPSAAGGRTCLLLQPKTSATNLRLVRPPGGGRRPMPSGLWEQLRRQWPDPACRWPLLRVGHNRNAHWIFPRRPGATYNGAPTILFASARSTPKLRY